jgi:hypothetical protein
MAAHDLPQPRDDAWSMLAGIAPHLSIAHRVPGRIRLKLAALDDGRARHGARALEAALAELRGLRSVRINALARSCVIEYDNGIIPDSAWPDLLAGRRTPAGEALLALLRECALPINRRGETP